MTDKTIDVIDHLVGEALPLRKRRPVTYEQVQKSFEALFSPYVETEFKIRDRYAVALFVAALHQKNDIVVFYKKSLDKMDAELGDKIIRLAEQGVTNGPYGHYPDGPLTIENSDGLVWKPILKEIEFLGDFLSPAFAHAHQLVFHPRDAHKNDFDGLLAAGWQTKDIVTLSQLVAFLSFQIRLVVGLQVLKNGKQVKGEHNV